MRKNQPVIPLAFRSCHMAAAFFRCVVVVLVSSCIYCPHHEGQRTAAHLKCIPPLLFAPFPLAKASPFLVLIAGVGQLSSWLCKQQRSRSRRTVAMIRRTPTVVNTRVCGAEPRFRSSTAAPANSTATSTQQACPQMRTRLLPLVAVCCGARMPTLTLLVLVGAVAGAVGTAGRHFWPCGAW